MNSLFAQLLLKAQDHIKANVPDIRWTDQDLGQLEWYEIRPAVSWPCCLIDFNSTTYEQMQLNRQLGNLTFTLRLGFDNFSSSGSTGPLPVREKALEFYELEQKLYKAFQGWNADGLMQDCSRVSAVTERREGDNFRVRVLTFTSMTEDDTASPVIQKAKPQLQVTAEPKIGAGIGTLSINEDFIVG